MADKIYTLLPVINQTTAVKNFFESTVEQLFAEANSEIITGFIGNKTSEDYNVNLAFLQEPTVNRKFYSLSPVVNTINLTSGKSEGFIFFDEYINTLNIYGANTLNQNKIFSSDYQTFLPPVNIDKLINFQEYYFDPEISANCHTVVNWTANTSFTTNTVIVNSGTYYIANRNFKSTSSFVNDTSLDTYTFTPDITQSTKAVITTNLDHNFYTGDKIIITGVSGMTEVNGNTYYAEKVTSRTLKLYTDKDLRIPLDSSNFTAWTSGGKIVHTSGPTAISLTGNVANYIDVERDITGKTAFTPAGGTAFRNGMVVSFTGNYVISSTITKDRDYIVEGVGTSIKLVDRTVSRSSPFAYNVGKDYINLERGSTNNNIWSRNNFWWHKDNYLDATDRVPDKGKRSLRPILEYDADLELYGHGTTYKGNVDLSISDLTFTQASNLASDQLIDGVILSSGLRCVFPNESSSISKQIYTITVSGGAISFASTSTLSIGDVVSVHQGVNNIGSEYYTLATGLRLAQSKPNRSTAPLFNLYKDDKTYLGDTTLYPLNNFEGNKLFAHKTATGTNDTEYGFPLSYKAFKSSSEIEYENYASTSTYNYTAVGSTTATTQTGYYYYKLLKATTEYHTLFKNSNVKHKQRIDTNYEITNFETDASKLIYFCGGLPSVDTTNHSGYDIKVKVNNVDNTAFTYNGDGYIKFNSFTFVKGTLVDVSISTDTGLISENSISKHAIPLSWRANPENTDIATISEPEYLEHFTNYMKGQTGFTGNVLSVNNFTSTSKESGHANDIVKTTQDTLLSVYLLDDQPFNLVDALRFNSSEYSKYKKRFVKELETYYNSYDITNLSNEFVLEKVLRNVISFSVGRKVFNQTYLLPFGDNYTEETTQITDTSVTAYTPTTYLDLDKIENSMLVYKDRGTTRTLLCVDKDYTITSFNPITITVSNPSNYNTGDILTFRLYDAERDSAQCPPTPSAMGLYPLYQPATELDASFQTAKTVLIGHDGSRRTLLGDRRDDIILEFENRIYNSAKAEFRTNNSLGHYSAVNVRPGHFRTNEYGIEDWQDLLNLNYANWVKENNVDPVANDFYDLTNEFTWNYRGTTTTPGYWRGWYEYYYDTVRPHTNPWEMLGFTEKPTWWDTTYITAVYTNYSSANTPMWDDIEEGKIVSGTRENVESGIYKNSEFNPYRRIGLADILPVTLTATLKSPYDITSTGSTTLTPTWTNTTPDVTLGYVTTSYRSLNGINVNYDNSNVYVLSNNIINHSVTVSDTSNVSYVNAKSQPLRHNIPRVNLNTVTVADQPQLSPAIAVLNNGLPLYNIQDTNTYQGNTTYHYNLVESTTSAFALGSTSTTGIQYYHTLSADIVGATAWGNATTHSGIVGWAFDGLPIYGPYGYKDYTDGGAISDNTITNIKSSFALRSGTRATAPFGAHTGEFTEDFTYTGGLNGTPGYVGGSSDIGKYNMRYGYTPESPSTAIRFYVCTQDDAGNPMFPYHVGGGVKSHGGASTIYGNKYFTTPTTTNNNSQGTFDSTATVAILSTFSDVQTNLGTMDNQWKLGDGAPVENAWKYSEQYPFAVSEALLLAKPGLFATIYSDPTKITTPKADSRSYISTKTRKKWLFKDTTDFEIHGDLDTTTGNIITNIGYTQFIDSWLNFQGLEISTSFAEKLRTLSIKLGHRFAGFVDKDTMRLTLDQYSSTGSSTNLILPADNITVAIHDSSYKTRSYYSGVIVEKTTAGWKVKGYDKKSGYFETLQLDTNGTTESVNVGGDTVSHSTWGANIAYTQNAYVIHSGGNYRALSDVPASATFVSSYWQTLNVLPQENSATATYYQQATDVIERVYYETEYTTAQSLFNFLNGLGKFQNRAGYDLGAYDTSIAATRDWLYGAKQFLFWTTGSWQVGNTIELSPLASKVKFTPPLGFVSKVSRSERDMFSIMDQTGKAIEPTECSILREGTSIEITPPIGQEIYGVVLYTKEIEHAMVIDNVTDFADTIFDPILNQRQNRIKLKATRTANWDGKLTTEGFMVDGDELIPNLDNLATTMGRYSEMGFVPVERDVYEASRRLYGYKERSYLNELDITDDQQFDFYKGMIQGKGTSTSLSRIAKSSNILQGDMTVYDEWAVKVGDFGDVTNNQSVELKIDRANVVQDPQLITLAFPQDTTGTISSIELVRSKHKYFNLPTITINSPTTGTNVATAVATLSSNGEMSALTITNAGTGYTAGTGLVIETANITTNNTTQTFTKVDAMSSEYITVKQYQGSNVSNLVSQDVSNISGLGTLSIIDSSGASNVTASFNLSGITDVANVSTLINADATINTNITASVITNSGVSNVSSNTSNVGYFTYLKISGSDFTLSDSDSNATLSKLQLGDSSIRYQPRQRYKLDTANNTVKANIVVSVANTTVTDSNYDYDAGDRWQIQPLADTKTGSVTFNLSTSSAGTSTNLINGSTSFDTTNYTTIDNNDYAFVDVYLDGTYIENEGDVIYYTLTSNTITFANVSLLPSNEILTTSNVYIIEHSTIDFVDSYKGDVPGAALNIVAKTNDDLTAKITPVRNYEITPDASDDEIILIDIDDTSRFLKKPSGLRTNELWKTTSNVSALGITDSKFNPLPNAGYVNRDNVSYQAFSIPSIATLFGDNIIFKPAANDTIHVAKAENLDWNVYSLKDTNATLGFVEQDDTDETAYLYLNDIDLFSYVDDNAIGGTDNGRYLDYHLVIKDADLSDQFVIWTNQEVVSRKGVKISNFAGAKMTTANVTSIGPANVMTISNITPAVTDSAIATANTTASVGTIQIATSVYNLENGDTVGFQEQDPTQLTFTTSSIEQSTVTSTHSVTNGAGNFTISVTANSTLNFANIKYANNTVIGLADIEALQYADVNATSIVSGTEYIITDIGSSDFTTAGSTLNANGTIFTANVSGTSGTGIVTATSGTDFINESNIIIPANKRPSSTETFTLTQAHSEQIKLTVSDIHVNGANIVTPGRTVEIVASNTSWSGSTFNVDEVGEHYITISSDAFPELTSGNINLIDVSTIGITGFKYNNVSNIHAKEYAISNISSTGFTVYDANVTSNIAHTSLSVSYFGKTQITANTVDHNLAAGDVVKLIANTYSGYYFVENATENTFVIDAPYNSTITKVGSIIKPGLTITTDKAHGIDPAYSGKRIAVHMADPNYYNQVYTVASVTSGSSNTISIADAFSYADVSNVQITTWSAGLSVTNGQRIKNGDVVYVANATFTTGETFSADNLNIGRPAVITTIDHNKIKLNNTDIVLNDIKSEDDIVDSINNAMALRRGAIDTDGTISFVMLNGSNDHKVKTLLGDYRQVAGYSPYVTANNIDNTPLTDGMSRAGTISFKQNRKGFANDPLSPLLPENKTPLSTLNTSAGNPAYIGKDNNYGGGVSRTDIPVFNINDPTVSPVPGTGTDSGAKPILDPKKALANISKKPCVDMCTPIIQPPTPVVPITGGVISPPQVTTICYGGTILNPQNDSPGMRIISATGHGKRRWTSDYSGYYTLNGSHAGFASQVGASRGKLRASALAGVMTWSDNGSTQRFEVTMKFSKAGTYYLHVFNAGRSGYNARTHVSIGGAKTGNGRVNSKFAGKEFNFSTTGGIQAFEVDADTTVSFVGTCKGGGNHWHGLCMHISTSATGLDSCAKSQLPATTTTTGYANIIKKQPAGANAKISYHEQHSNSPRVIDNDYFVLTSSGTIELCFDFFSGADGIEVFQGISKGGENKLVASTGSTTIQKLTDSEQNQILTKNGGQQLGTKAKRQFGGVIKAFELAPNSANGNGVKYGGKLAFNVDIQNGTYIKVKVDKPSIVYRYIMKLPNEPVKPLDPKQNPTPGQPCNVAIYSPTAPTGNTGVQSPIFAPIGVPITKKKKPNHGAGGPGYGGGGGGAGGGGGNYNNGGGGSSSIYKYIQNWQNSKGVGGRGSGGIGGEDYARNTQHNYGGFGLAPMAGFSMVPDIFKKTVKVTSSNSYGVYQPLTQGQFVNNTVQRVTGNKILPLAQPLRNVRPSRPGALRALDLANYPFWNELTYTGDRFYKKGNNFFTYTPGKIGSDIRLQDGSLIGNVLDNFNFSDGIAGLDVLLTYPGSIPNVLPNPNQSQIDLAANITVPLEDAPTESNVSFNESPVIGIQPKIKDKLGNYVPAGPMVYCNLDKPMPGHTIALDDMIGVTPGDELIINSTRIQFPGSDTKTIETALRCTQGSGYMVHDTFKDGKPALRISSCSNAPLTIRDGCAGGVYKEVLDFHVVRGFEQLATDSETSNTAVLPATTGYSIPGALSSGSQPAGTAVNPTANYTMYNVAGTSTGQFSGSGGSPATTTGAILSSKTTTTSRTTGGSGYAIGDRLRIMGGLPIASPYGGISELCIDMAGMNYSSAGNVKVYIGDGTTPGSGAKAGAVVLNESGGIVAVQITQGGEGYDFTKPPKVRIIDLGEGTVFNTIGATATAKVGSGDGLPPRVAKFVVSSVSATGTITSLQIIDRGIYKQFPADLTQGIPLEYDAIGLGDETGVDGNGLYFQGTGLGQFDPLNDNDRLTSPGGYDPIKGSDFLGGGTGARVFLTAREIPDCSERGDAKAQLGFPDSIFDINIPEDISACLNTALSDAGYDPDKIHVDVGNLNDLVDLLRIRAPGYDGLTIDELTPGFLEKLGIPPGDYNIDSLCIDAVLETPNSEVRRANKIASGTNLLDDNRFAISTLPDSPTLALNCIDTIGNGWNSDGSRNTGTGVNGQDPNSILGDGTVLFHTDMFQYELRTISGDAVTTLNRQQECEVLYIESARYSTESGLDLTNMANVWIDDYNNTGWAYLESNIAKITQPKLVDTTFVDNAILYDEDTGEKEYDLHFYDPFKGIIPGFIDKEITFKGQSDPVVYNNARSGFGRKDIGKVWWDTSTIAYNWYEQTNSNRQRWLNWGSTFPGSGITLLEWVEDTTPPTNYTGTGTPKNNSQFVVERRYNRVTGRYINYYYFWVQNKTTLENIAVEELGREYDTFTLAKYLADPIGSGLPLISFVSDKAMVVSNIAPLLREDEQNLQINFSRNLNPVGQSHTAWKLLRQNDNNSIIPDDLSNKLIDSLCGADATGQSVPDPLLSSVEAYGIKFRPRQSMFKDIKEARQVLHYTLNDILNDLQLATNYPDWDSTLPASRTYVETVNWFGIQYVDASSNAKVRYDNTFKPIYKVNSVAELDTLKNIPDNTIVQVKSPNTVLYSLHKYIASSKTFELISVQNDNVKLKTTVYTDATNSTLSSELRLLLTALKNNVFTGTNLWNKLFFALMKYAYSEQKQLDWAFKTSYIYIEKEEQDLIEINGLKVDNFDKVLQYFDEVKPYTAKIREYKDGKSPIRETIGVNAVSDFDKPPYADPVTGNVRILDDFLQADSNIIQTNNAYTKYFSIATKSNDPIRHANTQIVFDRVDYKLLPHDYKPAVNVATWTANATYPRSSYVLNSGTYYKANLDISGSASFSSTNWTSLGSNISVIPVADSSNSAIARNIVTLHTQSNTQVQANTLVKASDRAFKFNPAIQTQFAAELNTYYSITDAVSNANVISSSNLSSSIANITTVVNSGGLDKTLALVKTASGGDFQGTVLDGNLFSQTYGIDSDTYQAKIGFNATGWDSGGLDLGIKVENYRGVFNTAITGNSVTFEKDGVVYDGFDGVTFSRVAYGEERPQELILVEPLENLVFRVTTHANLSGNASLTSASSNASTVKFQMTNNIYGDAEFIRIKQDGTSTTTASANVYTYTDVITVANASVLTKPISRTPGVAWIGTERIEYTVRNTATNKISGLTRGTNGTSTQFWASGTEIINGGKAHSFASYPVTANVWLDTGASSIADLGNTEVSNSSSIMRFLHNRE